MDIVEEMIGTTRRRGMERWLRPREVRQMTVAGMSRARDGYRTRHPQITQITQIARTKDEGTRDGSDDSQRSMWVECRECEYRERVPSMNRSELIRAVDSGEIRCRRCGGRMVEG